MLYDQQGSVWVVQAAEMENFGGKLQPEQLGVANPVLILLLLPLFEKSIYPALERKGFSTSAPRRMCAGMVVASVAFFVAAAVDLRLAEGRRVNILWQLPQIFLITVAEILVSVTGLEYSHAWLRRTSFAGRRHESSKDDPRPGAAAICRSASPPRRRRVAAASPPRRRSPGSIGRERVALFAGTRARRSL